MRFNSIFFIALAIAATGCGKHCYTHYVVQTEQVPVAAPAPTEQDNINEVVAEVNQQRFAQGQTQVMPGLICNLYPNLASPPYPYNAAATSPGSSVAAWTYLGSVWQDDGPVSDSLNLLPYALRVQPLYQTNFAVGCTGQVVATTADYQSFSLRSDDSGQLLVDGALVVDNGGMHGPTTVTGSKFLTRGIHSIALRYYQGAGLQSLQLNIP